MKDHHATKHIIQAAIDHTYCPICCDHMFVPFMTKCGHNYCYECLTTWLDTNTTCPGCRTEIQDPPYLNLNLQNTMKSLFEAFKSLSGDIENDLVIDLKRNMTKKVDKYKKDIEKNKLFGRIFKNTATALIDNSDGVARCGNCHWEVSGRRCLNCHVRLRNPYINEISSANTSDLEDGTFRADFYHSDSDLSENNEYANDSFIDDSDDTPALALNEIDSDWESEDDSRTSSPVRQQNRYYPSILETNAWEDVLDDDSGISDSVGLEPWSGFHSDIEAEVSDDGDFNGNESNGENNEEHHTHDLTNTSNELELLNDDQSDLEYDERIKSVRSNLSRRRLRGIALDSDEDE